MNKCILHVIHDILSYFMVYPFTFLWTTEARFSKSLSIVFYANWMHGLNKTGGESDAGSI